MEKFWLLTMLGGVVIFSLSAMALRLMNGQFFGYSKTNIEEKHKKRVLITYPRIFLCFLIGLIIVIISSMFIIRM